MWYCQSTKAKATLWSVDLTEGSNCWNMQQIVIDDMQFGFMKGKGTADAIFMARQMQENFRVKGKKIYFWFCGFGESF